MLVRIHECEVGAIMHPSLSLPFIISIPKAASAGRPFYRCATTSSEAAPQALSGRIRLGGGGHTPRAYT
jgi:hypothetical protein